MIDLYKEKQDCCGCTACMNICPERAITMKPDREGFLYPEIDTIKCIECGLCKKVCAFQGGYDTSSNFETPFAYAVKHADDDIRRTSASGGLFTAISDYILNKNGVVYGAAFDDEFKVVHQRAETSDERAKFKGSKYVQSELKYIFSNVKEDLVKDKWVLFTGTPCQTAGLKSYLAGRNTDKLILCDVLCYGIAGNKVWHDYIGFLEHKHNDKLLHYNSRYKWRGTNIRANFVSGKVLDNTLDVLVYPTIYYSCLAHRISCHSCKFMNFRRPSDITIGDFWGIEKTMPEFADDTGVSLLLINTWKGKEVFESIKNKLIIRESNTNDCLQPTLQHPDKSSSQRNAFWNDYSKHGYKYVFKKYTGYGYKNRIKSKTYIILRKTGLLKFVKKIRRRV